MRGCCTILDCGLINFPIIIEHPGYCIRRFGFGQFSRIGYIPSNFGYLRIPTLESVSPFLVCLMRKCCNITIFVRIILWKRSIWDGFTIDRLTVPKIPRYGVGVDSFVVHRFISNISCYFRKISSIYRFFVVSAPAFKGVRILSSILLGWRRTFIFGNNAVFDRGTIESFGAIFI